MIMRIDQAGVVIDDVEAAEIAVDALVGEPNLLLVGQIALQRERADAVKRWAMRSPIAPRTPATTQTRLFNRVEGLAAMIGSPR